MGDFALFFYRPYSQYPLQCHFFTLALYEAIQRQLFRPSKKMILNSCQPKKSHHGQVSWFYILKCTQVQQVLANFCIFLHIFAWIFQTENDSIFKKILIFFRKKRFNSTKWCILWKYISSCITSFYRQKIYNHHCFAACHFGMDYDCNSDTLWNGYFSTFYQWLLCWTVFAISASLCKIFYFRIYLLISFIIKK